MLLLLKLRHQLIKSMWCPVWSPGLVSMLMFEWLYCFSTQTQGKAGRVDFKNRKKFSVSDNFGFKSDWEPSYFFAMVLVNCSSDWTVIRLTTKEDSIHTLLLADWSSLKSREPNSGNRSGLHLFLPFVLYRLWFWILFHLPMHQVTDARSPIPESIYQFDENAIHV